MTSMTSTPRRKQPTAPITLDSPQRNAVERRHLDASTGETTGLYPADVANQRRRKSPLGEEQGLQAPDDSRSGVVSISSPPVGTNTDGAVQTAPQAAGLWGWLIQKFLLMGIIFGGGSAPPQNETITQMEVNLRDQHMEIQKLSDEHDEQERKLQDAHTEISELTDKLRSVTNERNNIRKELVDAKALSETRGKELLGTRAFLTMADAISESEVVGLARTVNNEIYQAAASLCDSFVPRRYTHTDGELRKFRTRVQSVIGSGLTRLIENVPDKSTVDPLFAQIVLQALFCCHLANGIKTWHNEDESRTEELLVSLYNDIRQTESQAVSGRWRALTRARLRPNIDEWTQQFRNHLNAINHLAGWALGDPKLETTLPDKLRPVFKAADQLRRAMGEQVTSADIEIAIPERDTMFSAHEMLDDWGDAQNAGSLVRDAVGGTTSVGLKRRVAHGGLDETADYEIMLLPKVVLISSLKEIVEPPPPQPPKRR